MDNITVRAAMNSKVSITFDPKLDHGDMQDAEGIFKFLISVIPASTFNALLELLEYYQKYKRNHSSEEIVQKWQFDKWEE